MTKNEEKKVLASIMNYIKSKGLRNFRYTSFTVKQLLDGVVKIRMAGCQRKFCTKYSDMYVFNQLTADNGILVANCKDNSLLSLEAIDGQQRCTSIFSFCKDEFPLNLKKIYDELKKIGNPIPDDVYLALNGKYFSELPESIKDTLLSSIITFKVYDDLSVESESELYVSMNSYSMALNTVEIIKAKYTNVWNKVMDTIDKSVFDSMKVGGKRLVKEKNILELLCIFTGKTEKSRFTDNIQELLTYFETFSDKQLKGILDGFFAEKKIFDKYFKSLIINSKQGDKKRPSYHFYDEKILFYIYHTNILNLEKENRQEEALKVKNAALKIYKELYDVPFLKNYDSYKYYSGQGNDTKDSMRKSATLVLSAKGE